MATEPCIHFARFVNNTDYKFATVETTDDVKALRVTGLACQNLVKIHEHYRVWGSTKQESLVELASAIIDPYYEKMKQDAQRTSPVSWHKAWMWQLDEPHLRFAAKSLYTCYEMHSGSLTWEVPRYPNRRAQIEPQAEQASQEINDDQIIIYAS